MDTLSNAKFVEYPHLEKSDWGPIVPNCLNNRHDYESDPLFGKALVLLSDLYGAMDAGHVSFLALFDASSAFDSVFH